jgi:hypothetical protein
VAFHPRLFNIMSYRDQLGSSTSQVSGLLDRRIRWIGSVVIGLHVAAVVLPPLSFQAQGPLGISPVVETAVAPLEKYGQFLYIDRGYAFFAPDPGPSHLIQAAITGTDGNRVERLYPDLDDQWPRLLYHRHFMLAEYLEEIYQPPGPPRELTELDREAAEYWFRARARYEHVRQSVVDHLKKMNPGQDVAIRRIEHLIPDLTMYIEAPIALDDPALYRVLLDQPMDAASDSDLLIAPERPAEAIPSPQGDRESEDTGSKENETAAAVIP